MDENFIAADDAALPLSWEARRARIRGEELSESAAEPNRVLERFGGWVWMGDGESGSRASREDFRRGMDRSHAPPVPLVCSGRVPDVVRREGGEREAGWWW
jgi:hypothetical protein